MAFVEAKKGRTTSKRLFTRASKSLQIAIDAGAVSEDENYREKIIRASLEISNCPGEARSIYVRNRRGA